MVKLYTENCGTCGKVLLVPYHTKKALKLARAQGTNPGIYCDYVCAKKKKQEDLCNCCKTCKSWRYWKQYEQRICGRRASRYFGIGTMSMEKCDCWVGINPIVIQLLKKE